ncbi:MAG: beta galactosidase jelly roll domain-containing protein [Muribaculaceae bacterium]|nr:beta galactosidase jelly roll domain-containing protein [Muribaculaceae bacterium]
MIVQRGMPVVIWGKADPGEVVMVKAKRDRKSNSYNAAEAYATADSEGRWRIELPAMSEGSPYTLTINDEVIYDVTPGDVFLCSGQSNMELPVRRVTDMFADEIAAYENHDVREFAVPNDYEFHQPLDDVKPTSWKDVSPDNAMNFSALGYFFGKQLYEMTGVPVGIVRSCWGGTPIEAWISEDGLIDFPRALNEKRIYESDSYRDNIKKMEAENYWRWESVMDANDPGLNTGAKWYAGDYDDSTWTEVDLLSTGWGTDGLNPINGSHWFRKDFDIPSDLAGKPAMVRVGCIVDADSVYVNGVFVGNTTYQYPPRKYNVPEGVLKEGKNNVTVRVISQNGTPHFVPEKPYKVIVEGNEVSLDGNWKYHLGTPMVHGPGMEFFYYKPVVLYNAMIHPLIQYPVSGVVWYQGESNVDRRNEYASLLQTMINDWRMAFDNAGLPFYVVELADFLSSDDISGRAAWAQMRQMQSDAVNGTGNAYLIRNSDLGEWNDIHPLDKKTLGKRVADAVYGNMIAQ